MCEMKTCVFEFNCVDWLKCVVWFKYMVGFKSAARLKCVFVFISGLTSVFEFMIVARFKYMGEVISADGLKCETRLKSVVGFKCASCV